MRAAALALLLACLPALVSAQEPAQAPGTLVSWTEAPSFDEWDGLAADSGFVFAMDEERLRHWLGEIDAGREAIALLAAVEAERDEWKALAEARAVELDAGAALLAEVNADRERLRSEIEKLDKRLVGRKKARRIGFALGFALGAWEALK